MVHSVQLPVVESGETRQLADRLITCCNWTAYTDVIFLCQSKSTHECISNNPYYRHTDM